MKYYLSIIPSQSANYSIRKIVGDVGRIFHDQDLDVRYINPELYIIYMIYLGENINVFQKLIFRYYLSKFSFNKFKLSLGIVKIGGKREYKGLVYLNINKGGDILRDMYFSLCNLFGNKYNKFFIPHISLGRINKDLNNEEMSNMDMALNSFNTQYNYNHDIVYVNSLALVSIENNKVNIISESNLR